MRAAFGLTVLLSATGAAAGFSPHRLVVVVGRADDARVIQQNAALQAGASALQDRDVIVQRLAPEDARREWGVAPGGFGLLVIGKDGGIKLRRTTPVALGEIEALIDAMPMRQDEMKRRSGRREGE